ncbi:hypothetical protein RJ035_000001 [Blastomyces gilchristii]
MQVPPEYPASNDSSIRASLAQQQPSGWMLQELQSLRYFNKNECTVVPKLLDVVRSWQGESDMPVPQGYLVFIVMEKVPAGAAARISYFVDFEDIKVEKTKPAVQFSSDHFFIWGLARDENCQDVY